jgi:uncharacterized protein (TIGR02996 family)
MDPDEVSFLLTILEDPDQDTPRLVYADWLNEHGDPRGEIIRLRAATRQDERTSRELREREHALLSENRHVITDYLGIPLTGSTFVALLRVRLAEAIA